MSNDPTVANRDRRHVDNRSWGRYRQPHASFDLASNATLDLLLAHRSVRAFAADPVPEEVLTTLVAAAQSAPTSSNLQVWSVVAVRDPQRKARLAQLSGGQHQIVEATLSSSG